MAEKIRLTFLGTGSAIPTSRRNHPSIYLQYKNENILIDCGEGTQRQFRKAKLNPCKVTKILITHWHGDHVLGLPGLFKTLMLNGYNRKLEIYGPRGTKKRIDLYLELFAHKGTELDIKVHEIDNGIFFENEEFYIESAVMEHDVVCIAYSFVLKERKRLDKEKLSKLKLPNSPLINELAEGKVVEIAGKKIDGKKMIYIEPSKKISFVLDTKMNTSAIEISRGADILVCESTYSKEDKEVADERAHLISTEAATIAKKAKVKKLILTHLSQRYDEIPKVIVKEASEIFKEVVVAEDFDKVEL
ncbi:MAG: ribonuclease Z [Candidatus Pacearchaeota archaeon]